MARESAQPQLAAAQKRLWTEGERLWSYFANQAERVAAMGIIMALTAGIDIATEHH